MRARAAYISSLGTTTILVAAAVLMLTVVSALVAFRGWPGGTERADVDAITPAPRASSATEVTVDRRDGPPRLARDGGAERAAAGRDRATARVAGLVKDVDATSGGPPVPGLRMDPATPRSAPTAPPPVTPQVPAAPPGAPAAPAPPIAPPGGDPLDVVRDVIDQVPPPAGQPLPGGPEGTLPQVELVAMVGEVVAPLSVGDVLAARR